MIPTAELVAMVVGGANGEPGWAVSVCQFFLPVIAHRRRSEWTVGTLMHCCEPS